MGAGTVEDGAGATAAAPVRPSPGGFKQELDDLRRWLSAEVPGYRGAFLVEETGLEVFNDQPRPDLLSFASALYHDVVDLAEVVEEPRPESITLSRGDGSLVHLVAVESRIGRLILGVQVEGQHGLGDPRVIAATLRRVTDSMLRE